MTDSEKPRVSVVVRTRDEADRLRLTLTSLARQTCRPEIVVVDDGSADHTGAVVATAQADLPIELVTNATSKGRSAASNAGAGVATSDILLFLDGDTLAHPSTVEAHRQTHVRERRLIARGETWHLRCTRLLRDPETAEACPEHAELVEALADGEREALKITREQIRSDFAAIERRARLGVYPGYGPALLHQLEMDALRSHPECPVLWAAASGSNLSVERHEFLAAGGFNERLDINEHRELALRLCRNGARMVPAEGARTFHMVHRSGWRDPLGDRGWLEEMLAAHPLPAVELLPVFWSGLAASGRPAIASLPELAERAGLAALVEAP